MLWSENKKKIVDKISHTPLITDMDIDRLLKVDRKDFYKYINLVGLGIGA